MTNSALVSMAILKVNWDRLGRDYLENFVPIVAEAIRLSKLVDEPVSLQAVQEALRAKFGLDLPQHTIETLLRRVKRRGMLYVKDRAYYPNQERLNALDFRKTQQSVLALHGQLVDGFTRFCHERHGVTLSAAQAEAAIQEYLEENQFQLARSMASTRATIPAPASHVNGQRFLVGSFIRHLQNEASHLLDHFETVVKGSMLANAIFLPDPSQAARRFRNTEIYFDTPFLILALGYAGDPRQRPCLELLDLLYETGAELRCFRHTLDELRGVLDACAHRIETGRLRDAYGPSFEYFLEHDCSASDIRMFIVSLERHMRRLRIRVVDAPVYSEHEFVIGEQHLGEILEQGITYSNPRALHHDVYSVSAIMRLRRERRPYYVEDSQAVFVTTNARLARLAQEYFYRGEEHQVIGPCLTDYTLTTLLWLKRPTAAPDLPRRRIIADSYAATQPSTGLWLCYLREIDKLAESGEMTQEDYYLLRYDLQARNLLMGLTLGQKHTFAQGTVKEILNMTQSRLRADLEEELKAERQGRLEAEQEAREARRTHQLEIVQAKVNAELFAQQVARIVIRCLEGAAFVLLGIGMCLTFPWRVPQPRALVAKVLVWFVLAAVFALSLLNLMYGTAVKSYLRRLELALSNLVLGWQLKILGLEANVPSESEE